MSSNIDLELKLLNDQITFVREENARLKEILRLLSILNQELKEDKVPSYISEKISNIKDEYNNLDELEKSRKQHNYLSKLMTCIKAYLNLNKEISAEINLYKKEFEHLPGKIGEMSNVNEEQIKSLSEKALRYEKEVLKFEAKYPWLQNPMFNMQNISKAADKLKTLKMEKERLETELSVYKGLKPDIVEATKQLASIKEEERRAALF